MNQAGFVRSRAPEVYSVKKPIFFEKAPARAFIRADSIAKKNPFGNIASAQRATRRLRGRSHNLHARRFARFLHRNPINLVRYPWCSGLIERAPAVRLAKRGGAPVRKGRVSIELRVGVNKLARLGGDSRGRSRYISHKWRRKTTREGDARVHGIR
ncbi:hypothetical protein [Paraburkholderia acidisoli]|uniref:Uncharacterized protein n=1 Tax=Paraburkholderia acidisoli TaxID=2571748 RepID=A0A7Z2GN24_9BURK|nr:hypothetical protein [Paraburkholderia acidisoli]QGZ64723.1 hypothetical protein FAZ98_23115 [Paraburkholderia acidisoli]